MDKHTKQVNSVPQEQPKYQRRMARSCDAMRKTLVERDRLCVFLSRDLTRVFFSFSSPGHVCGLEVPIRQAHKHWLPPREFRLGA